MDGIITTDNNGRIILINTSAEDMIRVLSDEEIFIGKDALKILNITEYEHIGDIIEAEDSLLVNTSKLMKVCYCVQSFQKIVKEEKKT